MDVLTVLVERLTDLGRGTLRLLPNVLAALLLTAVVMVFARAVKGAVERIGRRANKHQNVIAILARLSQWMLMFTGYLTAITIVVPSFKLGTLLQTMGFASVAVGFAFRDIAQNFLAGLLILWNEPFRVDDQIVYKQYEGTVEEIQTRATFLRTYDGRRIVIPNAELFTSAVTVNTAFPVRRLEYDVGIGTKDDVTRARTVILEALRDTTGVLSDPAPDVLVFELADFSVKLRVRWWISPPRRSDALDSRDAVLARIKERLFASGIELPFPTAHVLLQQTADEPAKTQLPIRR